MKTAFSLHAFLFWLAAWAALTVVQGQIPVCRRISNGRYETVNVQRLRVGERSGSCTVSCARLCRHTPCRKDYIVAGNTCTCLSSSDARSKCTASNAVCVAETCVCPDGLVYNTGQTQCVAPTLAPTTAPTLAPVVAKLSDGTPCVRGTTCNHCQNPATFWEMAKDTKCGKEPCLPGGTYCSTISFLGGPPCSKCCKPTPPGVFAYYCDDSTSFPLEEPTEAPSKAPTVPTEQPTKAPIKAPTVPILPDGTTCVVGTTCNECINAATRWVGSGVTKCGKEPCWPGGTFCLLGTTCSSCCKAPGFLSSFCS